MTSLFELPDAYIGLILSEWCPFDEENGIALLDSAVCNKIRRKYLLSIFSTITIANQRYTKLQRSKLAWVAKKAFSLQYLLLDEEHFCPNAGFIHSSLKLSKLYHLVISDAVAISDANLTALINLCKELRLYPSNVQAFSDDVWLKVDSSILRQLKEIQFPQYIPEIGEPNPVSAAAVARMALLCHHLTNFHSERNMGEDDVCEILKNNAASLQNLHFVPFSCSRSSDAARARLLRTLLQCGRNLVSIYLMDDVVPFALGDAAKILTHCPKLRSLRVNSIVYDLEGTSALRGKSIHLLGYYGVRNVEMTDFLHSFGGDCVELQCYEIPDVSFQVLEMIHLRNPGLRCLILSRCGLACCLKSALRDLFARGHDGMKFEVWSCAFKQDEGPLSFDGVSFQAIDWRDTTELEVEATVDWEEGGEEGWEEWDLTEEEELAAYLAEQDAANLLLLEEEVLA